ncbi:MAG: glucose-1-phosphate thymidylyltransferase [Bdellovibrionaceae bacterium]|nr:glucose-1-phosphate thymidylyltransferase [Pseudobdellovibrionaceae bacterium]
MKGIVLAGGKGTRLYPTTMGVSKQLLPIYDKPVIYYPISVLMMAGIKELLIISTPEDIIQIQRLLKDGSQFGISLEYAVQEKPEGIPQAFTIGESFIKDQPVALILGDNFFFGHELMPLLKKTVTEATAGATVFGYHVDNPEAFGVIEFDSSGQPIALVEKPKDPVSHWAATGLYFYDSHVVSMTKQLKPSVRGELEITDLNQMYLKKGQLRAIKLGRGVAWLDTGTPDALINASMFVQTIEKRQGLKIACLEEIGLNQGFLDRSAIEKFNESLLSSEYGRYLKKVFERK